MNCERKCLLKTVVFLCITIVFIVPTATLGHGQHLRIKPSKIKQIENDYSSSSSRRNVTRGRRNMIPSVKREGYLFCKTGFLLEIKDSGKITGTVNTTSKHALIEMQAFSDVLRQVKGVASGRILSLNRKGRLISTRSNKNKTLTLFKQTYEGNLWSTYSSNQHGHRCGNHKDTSKTEEWFIAIKSNGSLRKPCKSDQSMDATHFLFLQPHDIKDVLELTSEFS